MIDRVIFQAVVFGNIFVVSVLGPFPVCKIPVVKGLVRVRIVRQQHRFPHDMIHNNFLEKGCLSRSRRTVHREYRKDMFLIHRQVHRDLLHEGGHEAGGPFSQRRPPGREGVPEEGKEGLSALRLYDIKASGLPALLLDSQDIVQQNRFFRRAQFPLSELLRDHGQIVGKAVEMQAGFILPSRLRFLIPERIINRQKGFRGIPQGHAQCLAYALLYLEEQVIGHPAQKRRPWRQPRLRHGQLTWRWQFLRHGRIPRHWQFLRRQQLPQLFLKRPGILIVRLGGQLLAGIFRSSRQALHSPCQRGEFQGACLISAIFSKTQGCQRNVLRVIFRAQILPVHILGNRLNTRFLLHPADKNRKSAPCRQAGALRILLCERGQRIPRLHLNKIRQRFFSAHKALCKGIFIFKRSIACVLLRPQALLI